MAIEVIKPIARDEAVEHIRVINHNGSDTRMRLFDLHERESWRVMGYPNWRSMAKAEFPKWGQAYIYFQLKAARIEQGLLDAPDIEPDFSTIVESLPESHLRELGKLSDPLEQRIAIQLANSAAQKVIASGRPTAALLEEAVETVIEIRETGGKVELDETIVAAEAKVILRHHERVQEHIDQALIHRRAGDSQQIGSAAVHGQRWDAQHVGAFTVISTNEAGGTITLLAPDLAAKLGAGEQGNYSLYVKRPPADNPDPLA